MSKDLGVDIKTVNAPAVTKLGQKSNECKTKARYNNQVICISNMD